MANSIGKFDFRVLGPPGPEPPKQQCEVLARPGVTGVAIWRKGTRGAPQTLRSAAGADTFEEARALFRQYCELIGQGVQPIVWGNIEMDGEQFEVVVLDVRLVSVRRLIRATDDKLGKIECDWDLIPIAK